MFRVHSGNYHVRTPDGQDYVCKLRGNLKKELIYSTSGSRARKVVDAKKRQVTDAIAVGDTVNFGDTQLIIEEILPRHTDLSRHSPSRRGQHTLVANLDQVFLVFAATEPKPDLWLLDKFIVVAEAAGIAPKIVINKVDLLNGDTSSIDALFAPYRAIDYPLLYTSVKSGQGIDEIRQALPGHISAVTGPSGVGKSHLLNVLIPNADRKVGEIGSITGKGRHTTTTSELVSVVGETVGWIADTPGLRQLEFWEINNLDMALYFREFLPYMNQCRFNDCSHQEEIGCAIHVAVEKGAIDSRRYASYKQLLNPQPDY